MVRRANCALRRAFGGSHGASRRADRAGSSPSRKCLEHTPPTAGWQAPDVRRSAGPRNAPCAPQTYCLPLTRFHTLGSDNTRRNVGRRPVYAYHSEEKGRPDKSAPAIVLHRPTGRYGHYRRGVDAHVHQSRTVIYAAIACVSPSRASPLLRAAVVGSIQLWCLRKLGFVNSVLSTTTDSVGRKCRGSTHRIRQQREAA